MKKYWSPEEIKFLKENWGKISIKEIADKLNRTVYAVKIKAQRNGLSDVRNYTAGPSIHKLAKALKVDLRTMDTWIKKHGFPVEKKVLAVESEHRFVTVENFWAWAQEHRHLINFSKIAKNAIIPEPDWVEKARKIDSLNVQKKNGHNTIWTKEKDDLLTSALKEHKYTYIDLAKMLDKTEGAIKRRIYDLNLKERPVKRASEFWAADQEDILLTLFKAGYGFNEIAKRVGKSEQAVRGKLERMGMIGKKVKRKLSTLRKPSRTITQLAYLLGYARAHGNITGEIIENCLETVRKGDLENILAG